MRRYNAAYGGEHAGERARGQDLTRLCGRLVTVHGADGQDEVREVAEGEAVVGRCRLNR